MTSAEQFQELYRYTMAGLRPEPIKFYKPLKSGDGRAASFNLRLKPTYKPEGYVESIEGGLFVDLVAQGGKNEAGFDVFKWNEPITAKLGLADVSNWLAGASSYRKSGEVPAYLRGKAGKPDVLTLFHKSDTSGTTGIAVQFTADGSNIRLSKSAERWLSIRLTLSEEIVLHRFLELALDSFIRVGAR